MKPDYEKQLEARVNEELKALGELAAPAGFASRVMRVIEQRHFVPWYQRAWQTWPVAWQAVSLVLMLAAVGGICFGLGELLTAAGSSQYAKTVGGWFASVGVIWKTLGVLANAAIMAVRQIGTGVIIAGLVVLAAAYAACLSLGSVYVRFAMARR